MISEDDWIHIWRTQQSTTISCAWRKHCRKIIRSFITNPNPLCWRNCGAVNVDHSHIFCLCLGIVQFWEEVQLIMVNILGYENLGLV